jgi:Putative ATPase subunit of terminase (gpP-like)
VTDYGKIQADSKGAAMNLLTVDRLPSEEQEVHPIRILPPRVPIGGFDITPGVRFWGPTPNETSCGFFLTPRTQETRESKIDPRLYQTFTDLAQKWNESLIESPFTVDGDYTLHDLDDEIRNFAAEHGYLRAPYEHFHPAIIDDHGKWHLDSDASPQAGEPLDDWHRQLHDFLEVFKLWELVKQAAGESRQQNAWERGTHSGTERRQKYIASIKAKLTRLNAPAFWPPSARELLGKVPSSFEERKPGKVPRSGLRFPQSKDVAANSDENILKYAVETIQATVNQHLLPSHRSPHPCASNGCASEQARRDQEIREEVLNATDRIFVELDIGRWYSPTVHENDTSNKVRAPGLHMVNTAGSPNKALWLQLAEIVSGRRILKRCAWPHCAHFGRYIDVAERQRPGRIEMHQDCREQKKKQFYREHLKQKKVKARPLYESGVRPTEIANQLGMRRETIEKMAKTEHWDTSRQTSGRGAQHGS